MFRLVKKIMIVLLIITLSIVAVPKEVSAEGAPNITVKPTRLKPEVVRLVMNLRIRENYYASESKSDRWLP